MTEKVNLKIEDFEDKKTKADKRYTRFKTSDGWMSAFGKDTIEKLKEAEGKTVCVEIAVDEENGFKNIRKFIGPASENAEQGSIKPDVVRPGEAPKAFNQNAMYVSYAKDIFVSMDKTLTKETAKDLMKLSIDLVKQAKEAFN